MLVNPRPSWLQGRREVVGPSLVGSPKFRLDLSPSLDIPFDSGFRFSTPEVERDAPSVKASVKAKGKVVTLNVSYTFARLLFASQCMIVFILALMIGGVSYTAFTMSRQANYYMTAVQPYVEEARDRGMHILKNTDESSDSLHHLASEVENVGASSLPAMAETLNRTTQAVAEMAELLKHPTLKMSLE
jgi:hypothetical protein